MNDNIQIAAYYFPNYHQDKCNAVVHGPGWNEWELIKGCLPKFSGHYQPKVPFWGYEDEADPEVMAKKIAAAADHGIDAFIFDWYHYDDGPFLERCLDEGFLGAKNNDRIKFALMWANHDWLDMHPAQSKTVPAKLLYPGVVTPDTFDRVCDLVIERYFKHPSYWTIDGKPYFSIYEVASLVKVFGSIEKTAEAIFRFKRKVQDAGLEGLHMNAIIWDLPVLQNEKNVSNPGSVVEKLGFDSVSSYVWVHHIPLEEKVVPYKKVFEQYIDVWRKCETEFPIPYIPNISMGWDNNPRYVEGITHIMDTSPTDFGRAMTKSVEMVSSRDNYRIVTINAWNEWTEGSYLEPDLKNGYAYLEEIPKARQQLDRDSMVYEIAFK